jgi:site-specific DNA-cytosine methylase
MATLLSVDFGWEHIWSVENVDWKRNFIQRHWHPKQLFGDAIALWNNDWKGHEHITQQNDVPMEDVDVIFSGFECDDASLLSHNSAEDAIELGTGRTGSTGRCTFEYVVTHKKKAFCENVRNLGKSNMVFITRCVNKHKMLVIFIVLDGKDYGAPARRSRQWMYITPVDYEIDQLSPDWQQPPWVFAFESRI